MGFSEAFEILKQRPFSFQGRASRSEFWWILLCLYLGMLALIFVTLILLSAVGSLAYLVFLPAGIAMVVAQLAVSARRLHDKGITGWANLLVIVPFGSFALLILWLLPGEHATNGYGAAPGFGAEKPADPPIYTRTNIPNVRDDD